MSHKKKPHATRVRYLVFCCHGSDCSKHGARDSYKALREEIRAHGLKYEIHCIKTECTDQCKHGPIMIVCPGGEDVEGEDATGSAIWYQHVRPKDAARIVREHLQHGHPVADKRYGHADSGAATGASADDQADAESD
ncbi:MAG: (2Fe-2S) ferredoxin domain-containing protein [Armatimonadota bacterium]|nr:(2Fe-2S) ferredoxin domain-containing protein [Armatimonadota bacterium]